MRGRSRGTAEEFRSRGTAENRAATAPESSKLDSPGGTRQAGGWAERIPAATRNGASERRGTRSGRGTACVPRDRSLRHTETSVFDVVVRSFGKEAEFTPKSSRPNCQINVRASSSKCFFLEDFTAQGHVVNLGNFFKSFRGKTARLAHSSPFSPQGCRLARRKYRNPFTMRKEGRGHS